MPTQKSNPYTEVEGETSECAKGSGFVFGTPPFSFSLIFFSTLPRLFVAVSVIGRGALEMPVCVGDKMRLCFGPRGLLVG